MQAQRELDTEPGPAPRNRQVNQQAPGLLEEPSAPAPATDQAPAPAPAPAPAAPAPAAATTPAPAPAPTQPAQTGTPIAPKAQYSGLLDPNDSVASKLAALTSGDSALVQQARARGAEQAQSRGLLNSSMAVAAAEDASNRAALPVAMQDSAQATQSALAQQQTASQSALMEQDNQFRANMQAFDRDTQIQLADISAKNQQILQNNETAQKIVLGMGDAMAQILQNPDMNEASKSEAIRRLQANGQSGLDLVTAISSGQPTNIASATANYQAQAKTERVTSLQKTITDLKARVAKAENGLQRKLILIKIGPSLAAAEKALAAEMAA